MQAPEARGTACRICQSERTRCLYRQPAYDVWRCRECRKVMLARMSLAPHAFTRKVALAVIHLLAAWIGRRNQLLAYARPM